MARFQECLLGHEAILQVAMQGFVNCDIAPQGSKRAEGDMERARTGARVAMPVKNLAAAINVSPNAPFRDGAQVASRKCNIADLTPPGDPKGVKQFAPSTLGPAIARGLFCILPQNAGLFGQHRLLAKPLLSVRGMAGGE